MPALSLNAVGVVFPGECTPCTAVRDTTPGRSASAPASSRPSSSAAPRKIAAVVIEWFASGDIWPHLAVTLSETLMAFASGTAAGVAAGLWPRRWAPQRSI